MALCYICLLMSRLSALVVALVVQCVLAPNLALAAPVMVNEEIDTFTVGDASAELQFDPQSWMFHAELNAGDPFSSATAVVEFDLVEPLRGWFIGFNPGDTSLQAFDVDPLTFEASIILVQLSPTGEVLAVLDATAGSPDFDFAELFFLEAGRYRVTSEIQQLGGEFDIELNVAMFPGPIPEPDAGFLFCVGLLIAGGAIVRHRRSAGIEL